MTLPYVLAHREDREAFYAFVDRLHESVAVIEAAVVKWLHFQHPNQTINKLPESYSSWSLTDSDFVSSNQSNSKQLETEVTEANFDTRAPSSLLVGYIEPGEKFQSL